MRAALVLSVLIFGQEKLGVGGISLSREEPLTILNEGVRVGRASKINCVGAGVNCTVASSTATLSIAGGGGGGSSCGVRLTIDLGSSGGQIYDIAVSGVSCVTDATRIACSVFCGGDAGVTPESCRASGIVVSTHSRVSGGFSVSIDSPRGATGTHQLDCVGGDQPSE